MSYHSSLGALSCPEQCEAGCVEKFGTTGYPHDECVKACLQICPGGGGASPADAKGAYLAAAGLFALGALAIGAFVYFGGKR